MNSKMSMRAGGMAIGNALARRETRMKKAMGGTKGYAKGGAASQPSYSEAMPKAGPN